MIDALSATDSADLAQMIACVYYKPGGLCRYGGDDPANVCVLGPCPHERTAEEVLADLARMTAERDAAQALLAERIGVRGAEPITTAFGLPLDRLRELAQADREGKIPKYTIGDTIYDRFGDAWEVTEVERRLLAGEPKWIYRCRHIGTNDYCALWEFEVLTCTDAEAALRRDQDG